MTKSLRRIAARVLLPFVLLFSVFLPRPSYAFAPPGAAPIVVGAMGAGAAAGAMLGIGLGLGVMALGYWMIKDLVTGDEVRIPTADNPASAVPAPVPSAGQSQPAGGGGVVTMWSDLAGAAGYPHASPSAACASFASNPPQDRGYGVTRTFNAGVWDGAQCWTTYTDYSSWYGTTTTSQPIVTPLYSQNTTAPLTCPAGYTLSGSTCNLTNPRQAAPDGKQDYGRTGNSYSPYGGDDAGTVKGTVSSSTGTNDTVVVAGKSEAGYPMQVKVIADPAGGSKLVIQEQKVDGAGQTYTQVTQVTVDQAGQATGIQTAAQPQSLQYNPTTQTYDPVATPSGSITPAPGSSQQAIQFPNDYARQGEAASAANSLRDALGPRLDKLVQTAPAPDDPGEPTNWLDFGDTFSSLLGWQMPGHASQCPTGSFPTPWGSTYVIDSHCGLITSHWTALQNAMFVVWTVAALFIVLRA